MESNNISNNLRTFFKDKDNIEMAFLFGSEAKNKAIIESDVDIAVWFKGKHSMKDIDDLWSEIEILLHRNIDLVVLNSARPAIAWAAMRGQRLLIRNYSFFLQQMLLISDESEFIQDFTLELFSLRQKAKEST